jgi:hypothetical protein
MTAQRDISRLPSREAKPALRALAEELELSVFLVQGLSEKTPALRALHLNQAIFRVIKKVSKCISVGLADHVFDGNEFSQQNSEVHADSFKAQWRQS